MYHLFIVNPKSFRFNHKLDSFMTNVENCFLKNNDPHRVYVSRKPRDAIVFVREYVERHSDETVRVYAVGGDGILFDCLNAIINLPNAELAHLPYGNSNDFLLSFGGWDIELFRDLSMLSISPTVLTDVLCCNGNYVINNCSIGVEAGAVRRNISMMRFFSNSRVLRHFTASVFTLGGLMSIFDKEYRNNSYSLIVDDEEIYADLASISIGNGPYYGKRKHPHPHALPNDGQFELLMYNAVKPIEMILSMPNYLRGKFELYPQMISYRRAKKIEIYSPNPIYAILDGEAFVESELKIELLPKAVNFVAPAGLQYVNVPLENDVYQEPEYFDFEGKVDDSDYSIWEGWGI